MQDRNIQQFLLGPPLATTSSKFIAISSGIEWFVKGTNSEKSKLRHELAGLPAIDGSFNMCKGPLQSSRPVLPEISKHFVPH
jgi:hypothetical protein